MVDPEPSGPAPGLYQASDFLLIPIVEDALLNRRWAGPRYP